MAFDVRMLAIANLITQLILAIIIFGAAYLAKKKELTKHCTVMRVAVLIQLVAIGSVMLPSLLGYLKIGYKIEFFNIEMLIHHTFGLAVVILWVYINLVFMGKVKTLVTLATLMRFALTFWIVALLLGLHMYVLIWV